MEKFDMEDLKQLIDMTEYLKQKYPGIDIEITVSEVAKPSVPSAGELRAQEQALMQEMIQLQSALAKYEAEFDVLEDCMPDPYLDEHLEWLLRSGDVEDKLDDIEGRIAEIEEELKGIRRQLNRSRKGC